MLMNKTDNDIVISKNESGAALVIALVMMIVLTLIGLASIFSSTFEIMLSGGKKRSTDAFYNADNALDIIMKYPTVFNPEVPTFNPLSGSSPIPSSEKSLVKAEVQITHDTNKQGAPRGFSIMEFDFSYFWIQAKGNDLTEMSNKSTCTIGQNVVKLFPKDESITEVVK